VATRPNPSSVRDASGFVHALRLLKIWAGDPSFDQLSKHSGLPRSTLADALKVRRRLPTVEVVRGFVAACGVSDATDWLDAWRRIQSDAVVPIAPRELPPDVVSFLGREETLDVLIEMLEKAKENLLARKGKAAVNGSHGRRRSPYWGRGVA